jgi:D-alanyl-D-alanine carboxypeptidase/D-alanyl-D-alanine-endopeptidase (penicillin-binding protein 4)
MKRIYIIILLWFIAGSVSAQIMAGFSYPRKNTLEKAVSTFLKDPQLKNATLGFYAVDIATDSVIAEHNQNTSLIPASTMKVVTTSTALEVLGAYHSFKTNIQYDGFIDSSCVLHGNIYIKGGGDPALGSKYFQKHYGDFLLEWADAIAQMGIDSIDGRVIGDAEIFTDDMIPATWIWGDIGNYYGAGPSGLSIYDNLCRLSFNSGPNAGDSTSIECTYPYIPGLEITNKVISSNTKKDNAYIFGAPYSYDRKVEGSIPKGKEGFEVKGNIADPAYLAAFELEHELYKYGIPLSGKATTVRLLKRDGLYAKTTRNDIFTTKSPSLASIVYWTNMLSVNLFAEHLMNSIGVARKGRGSAGSGSVAVQNFWKSKGLDIGGMYVNDGSGLSRYNVVTARQLARILKYMTRRKGYGTLKKSLPVAGKSGTLSGMCRGTRAQGNLQAKSGTMTRVSSYAGYVKTLSGKKLAFAMIINNQNCTSAQMRKKFEKLMVAMANYNQ